MIAEPAAGKAASDKIDNADAERSCIQGDDLAGRESSGIALSDDAFLGDLVRVLQPKTGYRAGIDAVLLASSAAIVPGCGERVLDAGAGAGVVGLCVAARVASAELCLVERVPELAALARQNIARNGWNDRISVIEGDLCAAAAKLVAAGLRLESFDHVLANPPFYIEGRGTPARDHLKAGSHAMPPQGLERWARFLAAAARPGGRLSLIHRADCLDKVLAAITPRFGAIKLLPIHPRHDAPAHRILVQGIKGSGAAITLLPGFVLHGASAGGGAQGGDEPSSRGAKEQMAQVFTPRAEAILRHGASLEAALAMQG